MVRICLIVAVHACCSFVTGAVKFRDNDNCTALVTQLLLVSEADSKLWFVNRCCFLQLIHDVAGVTLALTRRKAVASVKIGCGRLVMRAPWPAQCLLLTWGRNFGVTQCFGSAA